ncbi:MAG: hypothetical protein R3200_10580, partial [Xanthomonadales bacterium]|nr:hypothetical protein [Xanthomonadales bacterium]
MSNFFGELKRRNVFRVALLYLVGSWLVLQVGEILFEALALPDWSLRFILAALLLGFPIALVFSWVYELTPDGIKREKDVDRSQSVTHETSRKLDLAVIAVVLVGLAVVLGDRFLAPADTAADEKAVPSSTPDAVEQDAALPAEPTPGKNEVSPAPAPDDSAPAQSVAVLPFTTRSTDPEDEFFADGMHDDLLTQLAKIGALKVISRTSVMEYKETTKKVPEIADELNVATVVEGGVQRAGSRVRINAQLIDADTDQHLWAETFDRELTAQNIFDIQTEIATAIAEALQATLTPEEETRIGRKLTDNLEAWEAYRRGLRLLNGISPDDYQRALLEAQRALELDPDFAAAYSVVARVHMARFWFFGSDPADRRKAWAAIEEGRRIAPESPELDIAEAYYHYWGHLAYDEAL